MTQNGIAVPTTTDIDDEEQLATILETVIETAKNIVTLQRQQRDGHGLSKNDTLSPLLDLADTGCFTLADLENALASLDIEDRWQHDDWEPGDPCPECGGKHISVIEPREFFYTYDEQGGVIDAVCGNVSGPTMNHYCKECDTLLSQHPASALFWIE